MKKSFALLWTVAIAAAALEHAPSRAERLQSQAEHYEKEAERAEAEAASWAQRAQRAVTDAGATNEKVMSAIRKRGVLDWVKQSGQFKRLMTAQNSAEAKVAAEIAAAPYVKAEMSYTQSEGEYRRAAAAWKLEEASAQQQAARNPEEAQDSAKRSTNVLQVLRGGAENQRSTAHVAQLVGPAVVVMVAAIVTKHGGS
eukprot:Skav228928  [mRNA]  locus=scaffold2181:11812:31675:+ [translate_table: standard]